MIKKLLLISVLSYLTLGAQAYPCPEILFKYIANDPVEILPQELTIHWTYNSDCKGHANRSSKFVIELQNIFDEVLLIDTINAFEYTIKPENLDPAMGITLFYVREFGEEDRYEIGLKTAKRTNLGVTENSIERLNFYLLNGYFLNALTIVEKLSRQDLLKEISEQLLILFPPNYPDESNFFNSYLSIESGRLIPMPYVIGLDEFINNLNKRTKEEYIKGDPFDIELLVSPKNQVITWETESTNHEALIKELIGNLTFNNQQTENAVVLIKVGESKNGKEYKVSNERALIDPKSKNFRRSYPYRGPVH